MPSVYCLALCAKFVQHCVGVSKCVCVCPKVVGKCDTFLYQRVMAVWISDIDSAKRASRVKRAAVVQGHAVVIDNVWTRCAGEG